MMPETRVGVPQSVSFERDALPHLARLAPEARLWTVQYPYGREPTLVIGWLGPDGVVTRHVDAASGKLLDDPGSKGGSGFFYPFHYSFHLEWMDVGAWLLALVALAMLVLLVSGVIIHKKIFADFFTFRPGKSTQRATLDLHNASSILLLPFHFVITLSGLVIFLFIYLEAGFGVIYANDGGSIIKEAFQVVTRPPAKAPGQLAPVDPMAAQAVAIWGGGEVRRIIIRNPHDRNALVEVQRRPHDQVVNDNAPVTFDGTTGAVLGEQRLSPALQVQRFLSGVHMLPFDHWWLRWLYFAMGLVSCVMIATGLLLWVGKRRVRQGKNSSYLVVEAVTVAGTAGVLAATLAMLVANKLLPAGLGMRAMLEQYVFFSVWLGALLQALLRARTAWREQAWACATLAAFALVLNAVVTGDHLLRTLSEGRLAVAGVDLVLLTAAIVAAFAARRLRRQAAAAPATLAAVDRAAA
jgi:uncharacterized iron-regulated membrane protein